MTTTGKKVWYLSVFCGTCALYLLLFLVVVSAKTSSEVFRWRYGRLTALFFPTRWGFYTRRTAIEKNYQLYKVINGKAQLQENRPFDLEHLFGLNRTCKIVACETDIMARDTSLVPGATKYTIIKPIREPLQKYLRPDTMKFNDYSSQNVRFLKGKVLVTVERPLTWREAKTRSNALDTVTIIPINITPGK